MLFNLFQEATKEKTAWQSTSIKEKNIPIKGAKLEISTAGGTDEVFQTSRKLNKPAEKPLEILK